MLEALSGARPLRHSKSKVHNGVVAESLIADMGGISAGSTRLSEPGQIPISPVSVSKGFTISFQRLLSFHHR